jgi:hypothetical protein
MPQQPITSTQVQTITSTQITGIIPISSGGTNANTAASAINNLLPSQSTNSGRYLTTDGSIIRWDSVGAGNLSGNTLSPGVLTSSLTTVGALSSLTLAGQTTFGTRYTETAVSLSGTNSTTINCTLGNNFIITLNTNINTLVFSNIPSIDRLYSLNLILVQDATGGRLINWPTPSVLWPGGTAPVLTTTGGKIDVIALVTYNGGSTWLGFVAGQNY